MGDEEDMGHDETYGGIVVVVVILDIFIIISSRSIIISIVINIIKWRMEFTPNTKASLSNVANCFLFCG